jgi:predicted enzyme related to lactoylglutathione lyase
MAITRVQTFYLPADDVAATTAFYEVLLGPPRFRDGDRWVQFRAGETSFAIASRDEAAQGAEGGVAVFQSDDLADHERTIAAGAVALERRDMADHGRTATYRDPAGHLFQLFWRA